MFRVGVTNQMDGVAPLCPDYGFGILPNLIMPYGIPFYCHSRQLFARCRRLDIDTKNLLRTMGKRADCNLAKPFDLKEKVFL